MDSKADTASTASDSYLVDFFDDSVGDDAGEVKVLLESLEALPETAAPEPETIERALSHSLTRITSGDSISEHHAELSGMARMSISTESAYGYPLSPEEAARRVPPGVGGLQWHSLLINGDPFDESGKLKRGLNPRDFDLEKKAIKPRRAYLPILSKDFYSSLTRVESPDGNPRFIFHGVLNGWPSLQVFEVMSIERKRQKGFVPPGEIIKGRRVWVPMWSSAVEGKQGMDPIIKDKGLLFRLTLRGPAHSSKGWSEDSPGFAYWYQAHLKPEPTLTYGTHMIGQVDPDSICTRVHMMAHRYARMKENPKDKLTYHSVVLLEWNHRQYCTVIEAAYLNGLAGWRGRCNFYDDMDEPVTQMYKCFPPELVRPWLTTAAEVRAFDIGPKSLDEFKQYVAKYTGRDKRFLDPHYPFSHVARLTYRSKKDIAQYLINYIRRDVSYNELKRNCQTLSADLCNFVAGKKDVMPFHPVNRIEYKNRSYLFLYDPEMYEQKDSALQANELKG